MEIIFKGYVILCVIATTGILVMWAISAWISHDVPMTDEQTYNALKMRKLKEKGLLK